MKVLSVNNKHIKKPEPETEYGCTCRNCGTVFIFKRSEASVPRCINPESKYCSIICPNCKYVMSLAQCQEFKNSEERKQFEYHYDE